MKIKFIIARAGANSYWHYYNKNHRDNRLPQYRNNPHIVNEVVDCFLMGNAQDATKFDSYEEAQKEIESFGEIVRTEIKDNEKVQLYPGTGIYRIDKIFIHEIAE